MMFWPVVYWLGKMIRDSDFLGSKNDCQTNTEQANKTEQMGFLFCSTKTDEANRTEHNPLGLFCLFVLMWVVLHQNRDK